MSLETSCEQQSTKQKTVKIGREGGVEIKTTCYRVFADRLRSGREETATKNRDEKVTTLFVGKYSCWSVFCSVGIEPKEGGVRVIGTRHLLGLQFC